MTATLVTHCGAVQVDRRDLDRIDAPPPTDTWFPVRHADVIDSVTRTLGAAGFDIAKQSFALSHGNHRMFSTMDLAVPLHTGVSLAIGIRNSTDKTFPLGFCAGNRVFVCDNLAFSAELLVKRKHTRFGQERFREAIVEAVTNLDQFRKAETNRIKFMEHKEIDDVAAESLILRAYDRGLIPHTALQPVLKEWREPSFDFGDRGPCWRNRAHDRAHESRHSRRRSAATDTEPQRANHTLDCRASPPRSQRSLHQGDGTRPKGALA